MADDVLVRQELDDHAHRIGSLELRVGEEVAAMREVWVHHLEDDQRSFHEMRGRMDEFGKEIKKMGASQMGLAQSTTRIEATLEVQERQRVERLTSVEGERNRRLKKYGIVVGAAVVVLSKFLDAAGPWAAHAWRILTATTG